MQKRKANYDLLRIVSTIAVIMIHVSDKWFDNVLNDIIQHGMPINSIPSPVWICVYNSISRFAVPCFIMLSGAFILDNKENIKYRSFYSHAVAKIGIPTLIFSFLYIFYRIPKCFVGDDRGITSLVLDIIKGKPMYHMWYLYMLIGIYALAPIVLRFKNSISDSYFYKISFVFLWLASLSMWTSSFCLAWNIGRSFEYLGYFMVGYSIHKNVCVDNQKAVILIGGGVIFELCVVGLEYRQMLAGIAESDLKYSIVGPSNPLIVLSSVLIFSGFTALHIDRDMTELSGLTFWIYLIHAGVWDVIAIGIKLVKGKNVFSYLDGKMWIPLFVGIVFFISCLLSHLYIWLWNKVDKEKRITKRLLRIMHL